jgi:hypothetical protein
MFKKLRFQMIVDIVRTVELMDDLFAIDARARDEKMDHAARHALRLEEALPLLDKISLQ